MDIISADKIDSRDPHSYFGRLGVDTQEQFRIPWRRVNLGNEIRELHIMNDARVIPPSTTGYFNKQLLCRLIDDILDVQRPLRYQPERIKRRLFLNSRATPHKSTITRKNKSQFSTAYKFRCIRSKIGYRRIKKNYLDEARITVAAQVKKEKQEKRCQSSSSTDSTDSPNSKRFRVSEWTDPNGVLHVRTDDGMFPISPNTLAKVCKFHDKMVRQHPSKIRSEYEQLKRNLNTEACRLSRRVNKLAGLILDEQYRERMDTNGKVTEESMRSVHYLKALLEIINGAK